MDASVARSPVVVEGGAAGRRRSRASGRLAPGEAPAAARSLCSLIDWLRDKLERLREDSGSEQVRSSLHALERACDPATNPRLEAALAGLGIAAVARSPARTWSIPRVPRSANRLLREHWGARQREREAWRLLVRAACGRPPRRVASRVRLEVTLYRARLQDPDNAQASLKPLLDALVHEGWLRDDSPRWLDLAVREAIERERARQRTEIRWLPSAPAAGREPGEGEAEAAAKAKAEPAVKE